MKLWTMNANATVLRWDNGDEVLFSYKTPVAGRANGELFKTSERYSQTTSRHINTYLREVWHVNPANIKEVLPVAIQLWLELRAEGLPGPVEIQVPDDDGGE